MKDEEKEKIIYAGSVYEIIYKGERILHLRSMRDKALIIHVSVSSNFLKPYLKEESREEICR